MENFTDIVITATRSVIDAYGVSGQTTTVGEVTGDAMAIRSLFIDGEFDLSALSDRLNGMALFTDCPEILAANPVRERHHQVRARARFRVNGYAEISGRSLVEGSVTIPGPGQSQVWHGTPTWSATAE